MKVTKRVDEVTVRPAPTPAAAPSPRDRVLPLNTLDLHQPPSHIPLLLLFDGAAARLQQHDLHILQAAVSSALKASLARTLAVFYSLAGRLREAADRQLQLVCGDEGAAFQEVWVDSMFADFMPDFQPSPELGPLLPERLQIGSHFVPKRPYVGGFDISQVPLLLVQLTHFQCGGICLGVLVHHYACDGQAMADFLSTWAELTKQAISAVYNANNIAGDMNGASSTPADDEVVVRVNRADLVKEADDSEFVPADIPDEFHARPWQLDDQKVCKIIGLTPDYIASLKAKAAAPAPASAAPTSKFTRFEVLAAYLWLSMVRTWWHDDEQELKLTISVDGRKRLRPPVEGRIRYCGNVVLNSHGVVKRGEVLRSSFAAIAQFVKGIVGKVSDGLLKTAIWAPLSAVGSYYPTATCLVISSWWRFPLYELDFGWGKPSFVRYCHEWAMSGAIILLPSALGPDHVDAFVALPPRLMPPFQHYLTHVHDETPNYY